MKRRASVTSWTIAAACVIQRGLLVLVMRDVRLAYRDKMIATFEAASEEAAARGGSRAVGRLLLREIADLATARRANQPAGAAATRSRVQCMQSYAHCPDNHADARTERVLVFDAF